MTSFLKREEFFYSGGSCDLENYSLDLVPRKILEEIALKEQ